MRGLLLFSKKYAILPVESEFMEKVKGKQPNVVQSPIVEKLSDRISYEVAIIEKVNGEPRRVLRRFDICPDERMIDDIEITVPID